MGLTIRQKRILKDSLSRSCFHSTNSNSLTSPCCREHPLTCYYTVRKWSTFQYIDLCQVLWLLAYSFKVRPCCSNLVESDGNGRWLFLKSWIWDILLAITWNRYFIAGARQSWHTSNAVTHPRNGQLKMYLYFIPFPWSNQVDQNHRLCLSKS